MNKKGTVQDYFIAVIIIIVISIMVAMVVKMYAEIRDTSLFTDSDEAEEIGRRLDFLQASWDNILSFFIFIALFAPIMFAFLSGSHPAFLWVTLIIALFVMVFGVMANNIWDEIINNAEMSEVKEEMPKVTFVFDNFGKIVSVFIAILMVALFAGNRLNQT